MSNYLLAKSGCSEWHIIMAHPAHETIKLAAHELHKFLMRLSGASLPTQTELQPVFAKEILVGRSSRLVHNVSKSARGSRCWPQTNSRLVSRNVDC